MSGVKVLKNVRFRGFVPGWIMVLGILVLFLATISSCFPNNNSPSSRREKMPVIFDTDIGDDIDDTWALAMLLQSPELDIKLITTAVGNTSSKAKIVTRFLETVGRSDIPVGIGVQHNKGSHGQEEWIKSRNRSSRWRAGLN
jgi:hypothetical protein